MAKDWLNLINISNFLIVILASGAIIYLLTKEIRTKSETKKFTAGLIKFISKHEGVKWGTLKQVEEWKFDEEQIEKGLVKYKSKWGTLKQVEEWKRQEFEEEQIRKGLDKFISKHEGIKWGTLGQVGK